MTATLVHISASTKLIVSPLNFKIVANILIIIYCLLNIGFTTDIQWLIVNHFFLQAKKDDPQVVFFVSHSYDGADFWP